MASVSNSFSYYPFGMMLPGRQANPGDYRYGFNGKEKDNEVKGPGDQLNYGFRIYDSRVGRFLSIDPLTKSYPWYTPYQFAGNSSTVFNDLDGREPNQAIWSTKHPQTAINFSNNSEIASNISKDNSLSLKFERDGEQDAFRHALWMALNAQTSGVALAVEFGQMHELDGDDFSDVEATKMDSHNNLIGARIGKNNPSASIEKLKDLTLQALKSGQLKVIYMDSQGYYLNENGEKLVTDGTGDYQKYKVIVPSNTVLPDEGKDNPNVENDYKHWKRGVLPSSYEDPNAQRKKEIESEKKTK